MADKTKELEKKVAQLAKTVAVLEGKCKTYEQKIKVLADNTLDAKALDKFIDVHVSTAQQTTMKQMNDDRKRHEELVKQQGKKNEDEAKAEIDKQLREARKFNELETKKALTAHYRSVVEGRLARLEAKMATDIASSAQRMNKDILKQADDNVRKALTDQFRSQIEGRLKALEDKVNKR
ncbi:MAG: hypothetical protein AAGG09_23090 [Pseudomonadota bacterium]